MTERRSSDEKINILTTDVALLKQQIEENTKLTQEIKEFLENLKAIEKFIKVLFFVGKWVTTIVGAYIAIKTLLLGHKP